MLESLRRRTSPPAARFAEVASLPTLVFPSDVLGAKMSGLSSEGPGIYWLLVETEESRTRPKTRVGGGVDAFVGCRVIEE